MQPLRFVILRHEGIENPHFDLMMETSPGSRLTTWRLSRWPIDRMLPLIRLSEHRREYLQYEGPLSGGRGHVQRVAEGECAITAASDLNWEVSFTTKVQEWRLRLTQTSSDVWNAVPL